MKKTLFVAISILLVLFAFTACEGNPSGPDDGEALVTEAEAKTLATNYFNAIDFSKLIVEASAGSTGTGLTVTDPASNGFTVEFKDYKGNALTANTEAKISAIKSGSIKFTFSSAKSTVTANTYTAETVAPIVFAGAEDGVALVFELSGTAEISYETGMGGIAGLTPNTTVSLSKPAAKDVTISVGNVTVDFSDIEKDVTGGFGTEAEVPEDETGENPADTFTEPEALTAAANIFADLSREKLVSDLIAGLKGINNSEDSVPNVTLDSFDVTYNGNLNDGYHNKETSAAAFAAILKELLTADSPDALEKAVANLKNFKDFDLRNSYDITIEMTSSFDNYTNAFKDDADWGNIIKSGTVKISMIPDKVDIGNNSFKIYGIYKAETTSPIVVDAENGNDYSIEFSNLSSTYELDMIDLTKSNLTVTTKTDTTPNILISLGDVEQKLSWSTLSEAIDGIDKGTNYAEKTATQIDAEYFYANIGPQGFFNDLCAEFNPEDNTLDDTNCLEITTDLDNLTYTEEQESTASFTLEFDMLSKEGTNNEGYRYFISTSNQRATGTIQITFYGTVANSTFTATSFDLKSVKDITLSDASGIRPDATTSFDIKNGTIGTAPSNGIKFTVDNTGEAKKITGINESDYDSDKNKLTLPVDAEMPITITASN